MMRLFVAVVLLLGIGVAWSADPAGPAPMASVKGRALEVKDVGNYTYLRLQTKDGETWAAVARATVKTGAEVTIENPTVMTNFESRTLNRKFDQIVFGFIAAPGATAAASGGDVAALHAGVGKAVEVGDIKVAKATGPNARTVAEIIAGRSNLKNKPVLVRGKVVKFTPAIMGKNWIHLRDGSGSAADGTNDVLVTTGDEARIGEVVLVKGTVHTDRDLGSGYSYKVLIEEAALQK